MELRTALRDCRDARLRVRLTVVQLAYSGKHSFEEIGEMVGRARSMVIRYVNAFRAGGVKALASKPKGGARQKRTKVTGKASQGLFEGLKEGRWKRAKEIRKWLQTEHGIGMTLNGLYSWLSRNKAKPKVPRKSHTKKDPVKTAKFRVELAEKLLGLGLEPGRRVRLWVADEHRYGLIAVLRKVWGLRGYKPVAPYHTKYEWGYLYSAFEVDGDNGSQALFMPQVSLYSSLAFLRQISQEDSRSQHVVIWDQAGFHQHEGDTSLPANVKIIDLPPYSPELNPVEKIGDFIKDRIANTAWQTLDSIEAAIEEELRPLWQSGQRVRELIGNGWLLNQANSSATHLVYYR